MSIVHIHKRGRHKGDRFKHSYPSEDKRIAFLDKLLVVVAVIGPLMTLPQIFKIYVNQNATGISVLSWAMYAFFNIPWILYGFVHKEKPIIISYVLGFTFNTIVVIGTFLY